MTLPVLLSICLVQAHPIARGDALGVAPPAPDPAVAKTARSAPTRNVGRQAGPALANGPAQTPDTLRLEDLRSTVRRTDPRSGQVELHERRAELRLRNLDAEWLPSVVFRAQASYQTDVPTVDLADSGAGVPTPGFDVPAPPRDRYEVAAELEQLVWDGGRIQRRRAVERARLAEENAGTRADLYGLREELDAAYFTALLQQERRNQIELLIQDLDARVALVSARVREGVALPSQLSTLEVERIDAEQELDSAESARRAALERLEILLGRRLTDDETLAIPDPGPLPELPTLRSNPPDFADDSGEGDGESPFSGRPEWQRLDRTRDRIRTEASLSDAADRPSISLFARGAYGRPGLDFFDDTFSPYATVGARLRWPALDWGTSERGSEALEIQSRIVETERAALEEGLRRRARSVVHDIERLESALERDERAVALREEIEGTARRQLEEGVLLPADYVETRTDLFEARLRTRTHRIQLAEARVRLRTLLGPSPAPDDQP